MTKYLTSNALKWESHLIEYWTKHEPEYLLERNDFIKSFNINRSQFFSSIDKGVCAIDFYDTPNNDKLIFVSIHDSGSVLNQLNTLAENVARLESDSVYIEKYADYLIYELKVDDFPKFLLGPQHDGFSTTYYMIVDDHLIIGSSITTLKSLLAKIDSEETWGRQRKYDELISKGLEEVNLSYSFNTQQLWPLLLRNLNSKWKQVVIENALYIKQFGLGSIQFSRIDDSFYSNILLLHSKAIKTKAKNNIKVNKSLAFNHPLTTRPFVVKNHNTNLLETLVQDSLNNLHLIGNNGKKLWTLSLDDQLLGKVSQIDYYKNKKLQYFLVTKHTLYIVDRLGNIIESFPKPLPFEAVSAAVIDYDNSKNYRFLINDIKGNIYLLNKQGEPLEGWAPLEVEGIHSFTPFHQRVRGRDGFIYLLRNGILNMVSRRAEKIKGFPLELDGVFETRSFVSIGTDYKTTYITVVSKDGKVVEVNFKGELLTENQLFKQTKDAEFRLVPDALNKTFILVRQEKNRLAILDNEGTEMFSKDYLSDGQLKVQYYYFTPEKQVCAITDIDQGLTYLYTLNGELLNSVPINSSKEVGIIYSEVKNEYTLYTVSGDTFQILKF